MSEKSIHSAVATSSQGAFVVRSFRADDRDQIKLLHTSMADDAVGCTSDADVDRIEEEYFQRPQDHFWVADAHGQIVGTVALCVHEQDVAHMYCLVARDSSPDHEIRRGLVRVAANHARLQGCLKLVVHAQVDVGRAAKFLHRLGFEFSRHREIQKQPVLEFYLNLYELPELGAAEENP